MRCARHASTQGRCYAYEPMYKIVVLSLYNGEKLKDKAKIDWPDVCAFINAHERAELRSESEDKAMALRGFPKGSIVIAANMAASMTRHAALGGVSVSVTASATRMAPSRVTPRCSVSAVTRLATSADTARRRLLTSRSSGRMQLQAAALANLRRQSIVAETKCAHWRVRASRRQRMSRMAPACQSPTTMVLAQCHVTSR